MTDSQQNQQARYGMSRAARRLIGSAAILVGVFLIVWLAFSPQVPQSPLKLVRGPDGKFIAESPAEQNGLSFEVQAGKIEANNQFTSASSVTQGEQPRLACRTMLVMNQSDHLLAERVAGELLERLKQLEFVDEIEYLPRDEPPEVGTLAADVFITLDLVGLKESGLVDHVVDAEMQITMGTQPLKDNHSVVDHLTPPAMQFQWRGVLRHHSTTREVASSAAKYKLVASNMSAQLGDAIGKQLNQWREKFGLLPELPDEFYLEYHEPPELPLEGYQPRLIFSGRGLLRHNETLWECRSQHPLEKTLELLRGRLEVAGWKTNEGLETGANLRMSDQVGSLSVFDKHGTGLRILRQTGGESADETRFFVRYQERTTADERDRAVVKLFENDAPLEILLLFRHAWTKAQRQDMLERFAASPPASAETWFVLADLRHGSKQDSAARDALARANALLVCMQDPSKLRRRIKRLAETLGDEELVDRPSDIDLLRELGFVEIGPDAKVPDVEFGPDGAAHYVVLVDEDQPMFVTLRAVPLGAGSSGGYQMSMVQSSAKMRMTSVGQSINERMKTSHTTPIAGLGYATFGVSKEAGKPLFRATVELHDAPPTAQAPQAPPDEV